MVTIIATAVFALVVAAAGCGAVPTQTPTRSPDLARTGVPAPASRERVRAAWVAISGSQSPAWIAQQGQYFDRYGLDVDFSYVEGSSRATAALLGGSLDILIQAGPAAVSAARQGADVIMVAGCLNTSIFKLMSNHDISSVAELKGKTIAITNFGTSDEFLLRKLLTANGLDPQKDVTIIQARDASGQVTALAAGHAQAVLLSPPNDLLAQKQGAKLLVDTTPLKYAYQATGVATTRSYLAAHRPAVTAFIEAIAEALHRIKTDPVFAKQVMGNYLQTDDAAVLEATWRAYSAAFEDVPYPSIPGVQQILDETGETTRRAEDFIDASVVADLEAGGFFRTLR